MPLVDNGQQKIFFAHVPKTGGTSVVGYLRSRFGELTFMNAHSDVARRFTGLTMVPEHFSVTDLREIIPTSLDYSFAVVRNPLDRLLSEFRFQSGNSRLSRMSISTWLRTVIAAAQREPRLYQNHIRPQSDLVPDAAEAFRLEDGLDVIVSRIDEVTGTRMDDIQIGHLQKSPKREIRLYREDIRAIVDFYDIDFSRFGYVKPNPLDYDRDPLALLRTALAGVMAPLLVIKQRWHIVGGWRRQAVPPQQ